MSTPGSHVQIDSLSHRYGLRRPWVLEDISLTLEPGSSVALVGRSGCGKSTLLQLMSGLIVPGRGKIHIDGKLVTGPSPLWNVMFQKPSLYPWMNVEKNAALGMVINGSSRKAKTRVPELLSMVGMSDYGKANVRQLSGGQQQRVALARSLATSPELLLLDEPFAALDEVTRKAMQLDVTSISKQLGITQVIVTHDIGEAFAMADRIVVLSSNPGTIIADLVNEPAKHDANKRRVRELLSHNSELLSHNSERPAVTGSIASGSASVLSNDPAKLDDQTTGGVSVPQPDQSLCYVI